MPSPWTTAQITSAAGTRAGRSAHHHTDQRSRPRTPHTPAGGNHRPIRFP